MSKTHYLRIDFQAYQTGYVDALTGHEFRKEIHRSDWIRKINYAQGFKRAKHENSKTQAIYEKVRS